MSKKETKSMSKPVAKSPETKTAAPAATTETNGKAAKPKRAKVRLVSTTTPGLWVRAFVDVVEKYGFPLDPKGQPMVPGRAPAFGMSAEERAARKAEKEAEKKRIELMSPEEKLAYAAGKREERQAKAAARKAAERNALIEQLKAEIKAGTIKL